MSDNCSSCTDEFIISMHYCSQTIQCFCLFVYWSSKPSTRHFVPHSLTPACPLLTPLSSSRVELRCLPLGFFTNSFSQEAWSSFSMLFPALITLTEKEERKRGENGVRWFIVLALIPLTAWNHNSSQKDGESRTVRKKVGQDAVMSQRELAGGIKCFYYELMPVEDNGFRVVHCFIL